MATGKEHAFQQTAYLVLRRARPGAAIWSVDNGLENDGSDRIRMALIRRRTGLSLKDVGAIFSGVHHGTVMHAERQVRNACEVDKRRAADVLAIEARLA